MSRLRCVLVMLLWANTVIAVASETITVGGQDVIIPAPPGFVRVTADMGELPRLLDSLVAPGNTRHLTFIPQEEIAAAHMGKRPNLARRFSVHTAQRLEESTLSLDEFAQMKRILSKLNADVVAAIERHIPSFMERAMKGMTKQSEVMEGLEVADMIPLPPHAESERALAYSLFVKGRAPDRDGTPRDFVSAATVAILYARGKVLFLYCYAGEQDLEWTRMASHAWTAAVLVANRSATDI